MLNTNDNSSWGFGWKSQPSSPQQEKYPLKRVEPALRRIIKVADIDIGRLQQHRSNIDRLRALGNVPSLSKEHINATRTVQQIQAHMRQLEQTRAQVQEADLPVFDKKVQGLQARAFEAAEEFLRLHGSLERLELNITPGPEKSEREGDQSSAESEGQPSHGSESLANTKGPGLSPLPLESSPLMGEQRIQAQVQQQLQAEADAGTQESWQELQKGLTELNSLIHYFASSVFEQKEKVDQIEENVEKAQASVQEGTAQLSTASKWKAAMFPAFGALIGGAVGGPVGFIAGIKLGGAVALGGGILGLTGGTLLQKRQQHIADLELQNLSNRNAKSLGELPTSTPTEEGPDDTASSTRKSS